MEAVTLTITPSPRSTIAGAIAATSCIGVAPVAAPRTSCDPAGAGWSGSRTGRTASAALQTALAVVHPLVEGAGTPAVLAAVAREACVHAGASAGALFSTNGDAVRLAAAHDLDDGFAAALRTRLLDEVATPDVSGRGVLEIAELAATSGSHERGRGACSGSRGRRGTSRWSRSR
jgi:hypothetical protein